MSEQIPDLIWDDQMLELLAYAASGGWQVSPDIFLMTADLTRRGILTVTDGDEGSIRAYATAFGIALALEKNIITNGPWGIAFGPNHPFFVKQEKKKSDRAAKKANA